MKFRDHFSGHAAQYAEFRPRYPRALFEYLAEISPSQRLAWDCATGSGQAASGLAEFFGEVTATDASREQLKNAIPHPKVQYRFAPAEQSGLPAQSFDLVTVAQALHWFDLPVFFCEAKRVLRPNGVIAIFAYALLKSTPAIDERIALFYTDTTGPFWPPERAIVDAGYREIEFPFEEMEAPAFHLAEDWTLDHLLGYLRTWSATQRFMTERGFDPVRKLEQEIQPLWGDPKVARRILWPLHFRVGRLA